MTPADLRTLAIECGATGGFTLLVDQDTLQQFASALRALHMEEAAAVCDDNALEQQMMVRTLLDDTPRKVHSRECAAAIRALKSAP